MPRHVLGEKDKPAFSKASNGLEERGGSKHQRGWEALPRSNRSSDRKTLEYRRLGRGSTEEESARKSGQGQKEESPRDGKAQERNGFRRRVKPERNARLFEGKKALKSEPA
jgi:hypothetical protein